MLPHPEAGTPSVRFSTLVDNEDNDDIFPFVRIEISGDNVAFTVVPTKPGADGGVLFVFDWRAGRFKAERIPVSAEGVAFLRDDILINVNSKDSCIDVYFIPPITEASEGNASLTMLKRFLLPPMHPTLTTTALDCLGSFHPLNRRSHSSAAEASFKPFTVHPSVSIIVFTFEVCSPEILARQIQQFEDDEAVAKGYALSMVVHRHAFLAYLSALNPVNDLVPQSIVPGQLEIEWDVWGPNATRWFTGTGLGCTPPCGQRCIDNPVGDSKKFEIDVYDFNLWNVKYAHSQVNNDTPSSVLVSVVIGSDPTHNQFSHPGIFPKDIHCRLPYVHRSIRAPQAHWCTHMTEDYLVNLVANNEFQELERVVLMKF
ncbi:hypothetical protein CPB83DRAFT_899631 [Crepidotus variabilis]|uniref:Uncharacterized protein n=1 Tax=Crepidotus variabilis TaxID=179855 RepID=A0A9P6E4Q2_9AGAR|nr:hypothetical protein CPB83DRAFT_899631 [Crepidotus variabilis]